MIAWWELALAVAASLALGFAGGLAAVYFYARHVWKQKLGQLGGVLLGTRPPGPIEEWVPDSSQGPIQIDGSPYLGPSGEPEDV